jgi:hypothetical protein
VDAAELPKHGSGQCDAGCSAKGDHDWFLTGAGVGGDPVLAAVAAASAAPDAGPAPAEE